MQIIVDNMAHAIYYKTHEQQIMFAQLNQGKGIKMNNSAIEKIIANKDFNAVKESFSFKSEKAIKKFDGATMIARFSEGNMNFALFDNGRLFEGEFFFYQVHDDIDGELMDGDEISGFACLDSFVVIDLNSDYSSIKNSIGEYIDNKMNEESHNIFDELF